VSLTGRGAPAGLEAWRTWGASPSTGLARKYGNISREWRNEPIDTVLGVAYSRFGMARRRQRCPSRPREV